MGGQRAGRAKAEEKAVGGHSASDANVPGSPARAHAGTEAGPSPPQAAGKLQKLEADIRSFAASRRLALAMPCNLNGFERKQVHTWAQELGLQSQSFGLGMGRCIHVFKAPPAPPPCDVAADTAKASDAGSKEFSAVELDEPSVTALQELLAERVPPGWTQHMRHMTICLGPLSEACAHTACSTSAETEARVRALSVGSRVALRVVSLAKDNGVMAVGVIGCVSINTSPHVTIACADGHHPFESNFLAEWEPLPEEMLLALTGTVREFQHVPQPVQTSSSGGMPGAPRLLRQISGFRHTGFEGRELSMWSSVSPPILVRGKTGSFQGETPSELKAIGSLVVEVLQESGLWSGVQPSNAIVRDTSGHGGSKTYKVSCSGANPPAVALHSRSEATASDPLSQRRMEDAAMVFSEAGIAPPRLAQGGDWFIESWGGTALGHGSTAKVCCDRTSPEEVGALLARIHSVPIGWFDKWRETLCEQMPALRSLSPGSHVWWYAVGGKLGKLTDEGAKQWMEEACFEPRSPVASRVVTCHGDFHTANMVRATDSGKVSIIDFEFSTVGSAVQDFAWAFNFWLRTYPEKRAMVSAYLQFSGLPAGLSEVHHLILDAEIATLGQANSNMLWGWLERQDGSAMRTENSCLQNRRLYESYTTFAKEVRASPKLQEQVVKEGFHEVAKANVGSTKAKAAAKRKAARKDAELRADVEVAGAGRTSASSEAIARPKQVAVVKPKAVGTDKQRQHDLGERGEQQQRQEERRPDAGDPSGPRYS